MMSYILLLIGMTLDIVSCFLDVKKILYGVGSSGIPVIPLIFYWFFVATQSQYAFLEQLFLFIILLIFHIFVQYGIPLFIRKYFQNK